MAGRYLSGAELWKNSPKVELGTSVGAGGLKDYEPDGSWLQQKHLQLFYEDQQQVLSTERVTKMGSLCTGEWDPDNCAVKVTKPGNFWRHMGYVSNEQMLLHPEEALLLMDQGAIEIACGGVSLTIQQAYATVLADHLPLTHYQVYAHLVRLGFIVRRHDPELQETEYERVIGLRRNKSRKERKRKFLSEKDSSAEIDQDRLTCEGSAKHIKIETSATEALSQIKEHLPQENLNNCKDNSVLECTQNCSTLNSELFNEPAELEDQNFKDTMDTNSDHSDIYNEGKETVMNCDKSREIMDKPNRNWSFHHHCKHSPALSSHVSKSQHINWDFDILGLPNIANQCQLTLPSPAAHLLPKNIKLSQENYNLNVSSCKNQRQAKSREDALEYSYGMPDRTAAKIKASNWREYKAMIANVDPVELTPVAHLWEDDVTPLLNPSDAICTGAILEKLNVIENVNLSLPLTELPELQTCHEIIFDVYKPDNKFRKSDPGLPDFRICVVSHDEPVPDLAEIMQLCRRSKDTVPLHWAVVEYGDIAFYCFHDISLPWDISIE